MELDEPSYRQILENMNRIVNELEADYAVVEERDKTATNSGLAATLLIRRRPKGVEDLLEVRVAVVGNVVCSIHSGNSIRRTVGY